MSEDELEDSFLNNSDSDEEEEDFKRAKDSDEDDTPKKGKTKANSQQKVH